MSNMIAGINVKTNDGKTVYMSLNNDKVKSFEDEVKVLTILTKVSSSKKALTPKEFDDIKNYFEYVM